MDQDQLNPLARVLLDSYLETLVYRRRFMSDYNQPPTLAANVHHMRAIAQAKVMASDRWLLSAEYAEYGKLEVTDTISGHRYLLRSVSAVTIEQNLRQGVLFDPKAYIASDVKLLAYKFHEEGLDLSVTGTLRHQNRNRLQAEGKPVYVATWAYTSETLHPFEQGQEDPFAELGGLDGFDDLDETERREMNRFRAYRDIEGINQEELGELLGISTQMVSAVESGRRTFAGDLSPIGYSRERFLLPGMTTPLHRQRSTTGAAARKRAQELLRLAGETFTELLARTPHAPQLILERFAGSISFNELEDIGVEVRRFLQHEESGPIRNLTSAMERAGVCLIPIVGLTGIYGLSSWVEGVPVIGLSPSVPGDMFRFTLAHELGHLLLHLRPSGTAEAEANRFAGALLFPQSEFDAAMAERPQLRDFIGLKSSWGVSIAALVYRAHELEHIDDARYRALQIQMSKWHKAEPGTFGPVPGQLLSKLMKVNGGTSTVATNLGLNHGHLRELCNWSHLRVA